MLVVITAVAGAPCSAICTSAFCTAIAETPSMPATTMIAGVWIATRAYGDAEGERTGK